MRTFDVRRHKYGYQHYECDNRIYRIGIYIKYLGIKKQYHHRKSKGHANPTDLLAGKLTVIQQTRVVKIITCRINGEYPRRDKQKV